MKEERRGSQSRKASKTINVDEDTHRLLWEDSQSTGLSIGVIVGYNARVAHDLRKNEGVKIYDPDWKTKLRTYTEKVEASSQEGCSHRHLIEGKYKCVWNKFDGPPTIRVLSGTLEGADEACLGCKESERSRKALSENVSLRYENKQLERATRSAVKVINELEGELQELRGMQGLNESELVRSLRMELKKEKEWSQGAWDLYCEYEGIAARLTCEVSRLQGGCEECGGCEGEELPEPLEPLSCPRPPLHQNPDISVEAMPQPLDVS